MASFSPVSHHHPPASAFVSWDSPSAYNAYDPSICPSILHHRGSASSTDSSASIFDFSAQDRVSSASPTSLSSNSPPTFFDQQKLSAEPKTMSRPYATRQSTVQFAKQPPFPPPTQTQPHTQTQSRRSRAAKSTPPKRGSSSLTEDGDEEDAQLQQDLPTRKMSKAERKKERNRIAANKCREKARSETETLKALEGQLSQQREELVRSVAALKEEIYQLEQHCFTHVNCNCVRIREYLLNRMRQAPPSNIGPNLIPQPHMPDPSFRGYEDDAGFDLVDLA